MFCSELNQLWKKLCNLKNQIKLEHIRAAITLGKMQLEEEEEFIELQERGCIVDKEQFYMQQKQKRDMEERIANMRLEKITKSFIENIKSHMECGGCFELRVEAKEFIPRKMMVSSPNMETVPMSYSYLKTPPMSSPMSSPMTSPMTSPMSSPMSSPMASPMTVISVVTQVVIIIPILIPIPIMHVYGVTGGA